MVTVATFGAGCGSGKVCANDPQTAIDLIHDRDGTACVRG